MTYPELINRSNSRLNGMQRHGISPRTPNTPTFGQLLRGEDPSKGSTSYSPHTFGKEYDLEEDHGPGQHKKSVLAKVKEKARKWKSTLSKKKHSEDNNTTPSWGVSLEDEDDDDDNDDPEYLGAPMYESEMAPQGYKKPVREYPKSATGTYEKHVLPSSVSHAVIPEKHLLSSRVNHAATPEKNVSPSSVSHAATPEKHVSPSSVSHAATPEKHVSPSSVSHAATPEKHVSPSSVSHAATPEKHVSPSSVSHAATPEKHVLPSSASHPATPEKHVVPSSASNAATPEKHVLPISVGHAAGQESPREKQPVAEKAAEAQRKNEPSRTVTLAHNVSEKLEPALTAISDATYSIASKVQNLTVSAAEALAPAAAAPPPPPPPSNSEKKDLSVSIEARQAALAPVATSGQSSTTEHIWDKGVSVKEYIMNKLEPGEDERALSQVISKAISPKKSPGDKSVVDKLREAVNTLLNKEESSQRTIYHSAHSSYTHIPVSTNAHEVQEEENHGRIAQAN